jgi:hypothetical protein
MQAVITVSRTLGEADFIRSNIIAQTISLRPPECQLSVNKPSRPYFSKSLRQEIQRPMRSYVKIGGG